MAEPRDLAAIISFDAFPGDRIIEIVERRMLVLEIDGQAQGYASWQKNGCIGKDYVNKLVVSEVYRGMGIAKQLITALNTVLFGRVFISASASNVVAIQLLEATSWVRAGEITGLLPFGEAGIVGRFAWSAEVQRHAVLVRPAVECFRDEFRLIVDANGLGCGDKDRSYVVSQITHAQRTRII